MRRDLDLIRKMLLSIEKDDVGKEEGSYVEFSGNDANDVLSGHMRLLVEAGYIESSGQHVFINEGGHGELSSSMLARARITWAGHDFLDTIRDEKVWTKTLQKLATVSGSAAMDVVKALAISYMRKELGLSA